MKNYQNNLAVRFEKIVSQNRNRTAIIFEEHQRLSYDQLDQLSNQVARFLQDKGIGRGDCVCINLDKTAAAYCVILGCLKIGATYFAIDPNSPVKRVVSIFNHCPPVVIFSEKRLQGNFFDDKTILCEEIHDKLSFCEQFSSAPLELSDPAIPSDMAYIMFTSGSTGVPKGAVMTQANLFHFIDWAVRDYQFTTDDIHTHINPLYFDNSVFDIYSTFFSGGTLVSFKTTLLQNPSGIVEKINRFKCTVFFSVPSMLMFLQSTKVIDSNLMGSLKKIIFGGEGYPKGRLKELFDILGKRTQLINVYGPTECTCICSSYLINAGDFGNLEGYPPIGNITANFSHYLLEENRRVSDGDVGELCLGGPCVGQGYFNQPELTKKAFVQNPLNHTFEERVYRTGDLMRFNFQDGKLWFIGRKDFQIKHQGYRIELEEIEHALAAVEGIDEAIALHTVEDGISKIVGVVSSRKDLKPSVIRSQAAQLIPKYMVPNKIKIIDRMPKNANGKTDRKKLKEMFINEQVQSGVI